MLERSVTLGYGEGSRAGVSDREDRWRFDYRNAYGYQDAMFGYDSYAVDLNEYRYYFREGFRRGYEDGYYGRSRYGAYSNGSFNLVAGGLHIVLNLRRF